MKRKAYDRRAAFVRKYGPDGGRKMLSLLGKNMACGRWHRGS
jgi:hypothetical protein